jgi:hypothetical protein
LLNNFASSKSLLKPAETPDDRLHIQSASSIREDFAISAARSNSEPPASTYSIRMTLAVRQHDVCGAGRAEAGALASTIILSTAETAALDAWWRRVAACPYAARLAKCRGELWVLPTKLDEGVAPDTLRGWRLHFARVACRARTAPGLAALPPPQLLHEFANTRNE